MEKRLFKIIDNSYNNLQQYLGEGINSLYKEVYHSQEDKNK